MSLPDRTPKEIRDEVGDTVAARGNIVHVSVSDVNNESEGQLTEDISRIQSAVKAFSASIPYDLGGCDLLAQNLVGVALVALKTDRDDARAVLGRHAVCERRGKEYADA